MNKELEHDNPKSPGPLRKTPPEKGYYIAGFVDGEGSFFISARRRADFRSGWRLSIHFNVSNCDRPILEICRSSIGCGTIRQSRPGFYTLEVEGNASLGSYVIPFFRRFGFLSNKKKAEFRIFQQAYQLLEKGIHTPDDLDQFLRLRQQLNAQRKTRTTHSDSMIRSTFSFVKESPETIR